MEVGEYIRSKQGLIDKIIDIRNTYSGRKLIGFKKSNSLISDIGFNKNIVKHSKKLIDLIEVGDMVHTKDVLNEDWYWMFDEEMVKATKETIEEGIDLVEIVTKEQLEEVSYKVERKD